MLITESIVTYENSLLFLFYVLSWPVMSLPLRTEAAFFSSSLTPHHFSVCLLFSAAVLPIHSTAGLLILSK